MISPLTIKSDPPGREKRAFAAPHRGSADKLAFKSVSLRDKDHGNGLLNLSAV